MRDEVLWASRAVWCGFSGQEPPDALVEEAREGRLGGVVLFARNVGSTVDAVSRLVAAIVDSAPADARPAVAVDQEGGRVVRLRAPFTELPAAAELARAPADAVYRAGRLVGRELRSVGITVNFAPVLDVATNPASPVIGDRAFGRTPDQVEAAALPFARGLRDGGVAPCAKHFPGHGDAHADSHVELPQVSGDARRLWTVEMAPFFAWARAGLGPVMTAHVRYPALDPVAPATCSRAIVTGWLRERIGFRGVVISDDLEMGAVAATGDIGDYAVAAVRAGVDVLLVCSRWDQRNAVVERLTREAQRHGDFARKLQKSVARAAGLAYPGGARVPSGYVGSPEHAREQEAVKAALA